MIYHKSGFTLVELLAAAAVIGIGMVFILGALGRCMTTLTTAQRTIDANYLLCDKLWEFDMERRASNGVEKEGEWEGTFDEPNGRYNWSRAVTSITADFGNRTSIFNQTFAEETVRVVWKQGKANRSVDVTRYVKRKQE